MAAMFTAKDLEVYKDSIKEKKNRTTKPADKPPVKTPPSVTKSSKPPLKLNNEEPLKERKPLSVVHKASNTIKDPLKPPSPTPVGSSKQADQWRKAKETALKSPPPGKIRTTNANPFVKSSEYKTDPLKSPREMLPPKSLHTKSDDNKAMGVHKLSTHASPVHQKSPSLSGGAKATPTVDVNASLCSECTRSASEGAVCFIGNDGRVSACTTRSAVRLCKNLNCAANNPEYVAAMANAPKKYLISKRHLLKAQFGPKIKTSRSKSPSAHQTDVAENGRMSPPQDAVSSSVEELSPHNVDVSANFELGDADFSLLGGDLGPFDEEMSLFDRNLGVEKDELGLKNGIASMVDEHTNFSFHDGEAAEPESPKFLVVESLKNLNETHLAGGSYNSHEDAESLAIDSFEEPEDEDLDGSPMHGESKAEELFINYGDLMSSEEVDADDASGLAIEHIVKSQMANAGLIASNAEEVNDTLPTMGCEEAEQVNQTGDISPAANVNPDAESILPSTISMQQVVDDTCGDEDLPKLDSEQRVDDDAGGCLVSSESGQIVDDETSGGNSTIVDDMHILCDDQKGSDINDGLEHSGDLASLSVAGDKEDDYPPLLVGDDGLSAVRSPDDIHIDVHEGGITSLQGAEEDERSNDDLTSSHDSGHVEDEDQSDEDDSEDDELDAQIRDTSATDENVRIDAQEGKDDRSTERVGKDEDGNLSNNSTRRQRRRRALRVIEEVSPETVILRKQQMLERKQAEEWMLNHAIEGVVHKLAPTGEAKVKILVEAFESIISHTDAETIDTHNARQEKRTVT